MKWQKFPLWEKQKEALETVKQKIRKLGGFGLFLEMGTGKTRIAIHLIEDLMRTDDIKFIGVGGPLSVLRVWVEAWHEWGKHPMLFIDLHECGPEGLRQAYEMSKHRPVVCLINYEAVWQMGYRVEKRVNRKTQEVVKRTVKVDTSFDDFDWDLFILDESTAIKTPGTKVSRFLRNKMAKLCKYRLPMTGSAYIKRPLDVWAQIQFALDPDPNDPKPLFPKTFEHFKYRYAIPHPYIRGAIKGYQNLEDLAARLNQVAVLLKKSDVLDLKDPVHQTRYVYLDDKTRKMYDTLVQDQYLELEGLEKEGLTVTASHLFTLIQKRLQLTSGFLVTDPQEDPTTGLFTKREIVRVGDEKTRELVSELQERDDPTLIVVQWNEEERMVVEAVQKQFKFKPKVLNGSVKGAEARIEMIKDASKDLCFVVKESVGCRGLDMQAFDMTIWYSHRQHTEAYDQMLARNHRGEQKKLITYRHLTAIDTYDENILDSLRRDINLARELERNWRKLFR